MQPTRNLLLYITYFQTLILSRVFPQIRLRQAQERCRRCWPVLLHVDKGASQLDETLVKGTFWAIPLGQPKFLQHLMGFEEELPVKALKITQIVGDWVVKLEVFYPV